MDQEIPTDTSEVALGCYTPPRFEVIPLDCEISAYAPAEDDPLF